MGSTVDGSRPKYREGSPRLFVVSGERQAVEFHYGSRFLTAAGRILAGPSHGLRQCGKHDVGPVHVAAAGGRDSPFLGAARGRLIRQLLTESILLALPAAAAGMVVSQAIIRICVRVLLATLPPSAADFAARIPELSLDFRVFGFALAAALVSAIAFGLVSALQATRANVIEAAKGDFGRESRPSRLRNSLVICQVTVCVLLLVTAGVLLRGVDRVHSLDTALSTRNTIEIAVQEKSREAALTRLSAEPSVESIAAAECAPVLRKPVVSVRPAEGGVIFDSFANHVSPEYFGLYEIPIVRGRNFTPDEARPAAPVAIISQTAAQRLWPNQAAVGRSLRLVPDRRTESRLRVYQTVSVIGIAPR